MKDTLARVSNIVIALAFVWLLYVGIGGVSGKVAAAMLLVITIIACVLDIKLKIDIRDKFETPLLMNLILFVGGIIGVCLPAAHVSPVVAVPFLVLLALGGLLGIIRWLYGRPCLAGSWKQIVSHEMRFTSDFDIGVLIFLVLAYLEGKIFFTPFYGIVAFIVVGDLIRNLIKRR